MANETLPNIGRLTSVTGETIIAASNADGILGGVSVEDLGVVIGTSTAVAYRGSATSATDPGTPETPEYYTFSTAGTYTNFKDDTDTAIEVAANEAGNLSYNGTYWTKQVIPVDLSGYLPKAEVGKVPGNQLFDKTDTLIGSYVNSSGDLTSSVGFRAIEFPLDATEGNITISGFTPQTSPNKYAAFVNLSNAVIGAASIINTATKTLAIPAGTVKIRFTAKNAAETDAVLDTIMVNYGTGALPYETYQLLVTSVDGSPIPNANIPVYSKSEVDALLPTVNTVPAGINMADPASIIMDSYVSTSNFNVGSPAGWARLDYVAVIPGTQYWISGLPSSSSKAIQYADASKVKLVATPGVLITSTTFTFTAPAGCYFVTFTVKRDTDSLPTQLMLNAGSAALAYVPYEPAQLVNTIDGQEIKARALASGATLNGHPIATTDMLPPTSATRTKLLKVGNEYYVRTRFDDTRDLVQKNSFAFSSPNNQNTSFDFWATYLIANTAIDSAPTYEAGQVLKSGRDDVAPFNTLAHGHIGEGHGISCPVVTATAHGKTSADLMSKWAGTLRNWYLVQILDANTLVFVCEPYLISTGELATTDVISGSTLTHVSGATNTSSITIAAQTATQQYPVHFNRTNKVQVDNKDITVDGLYQGNEVKFICEYDIADPSAYTMTTPWSFDKGPSFVRMQVNYLYQPNGACVIFHTVDFLRQKTLNFWYVLQATRIAPTGAYTRVFSYIPKVKAIAGQDYQNIVETTTIPAGTDFLNSDRVDALLPPDRHIQLLSGADGVKKVGFAMGFSTDLGISKNSVRAANAVDWQLASTSGKSYPRILVDYPALNQVLLCVSYRTYFNAEQIGLATSAYSYKVGNVDYLVLDFHGAKTKAVVPVQQSLAGKRIEVLEKTATLTLITSDYVPAAGVMVTTTTTSGNNNYAILKLT